MNSKFSTSVSKTKRILVCDDDSLFRKTLGLLLRDYGEVTYSQNTEEAFAILERQTFDLLLLDIQMRQSDEGLRALPKVRAAAPELTIIMVSGQKDFAVVRDALRHGADDYLSTDFEPEEFQLTIERALGLQALQKSNRKRNAETNRTAKKYRLIGESAPILQVRKLIEKFRASDANVLIRGETGTGKEIVARQLRKTEGDGSLEPFVAIDSATLHAQTAESLLFGHEKGAFTGADATKRGLFEEADGGAIFFDEIGNLPLEIQAKLLRVLQEKEVTRLGSTRTIPLTFRVLAATSRPLEEMTKTGAFLPDLWQRLNVLPIHLPSLRERTEDIATLAEYFLMEKSKGRVKFTDSALEALRGYAWPGNVRELSALVDYSLALVEDSIIDVADLHPKILEQAPPPAVGSSGFYDKVAEFEAGVLRAAYSMHEGNISRLALELGMDRSHLHTKLKLYGIHAPRSRA